MPRWFVLIVEPRREFTVEAGLAGLARVFLPLTFEWRRGAFRRRPLLPGYLFLEDRKVAWDKVMAAKGVAAVLKDTAGRAVRVMDEELAAVRLADVRQAPGRPVLRTLAELERWLE